MVYVGPCQTSMTELFCKKKFKGSKSLTIISNESSTTHVWQGPKNESCHDKEGTYFWWSLIFYCNLLLFPLNIAKHFFKKIKANLLKFTIIWILISTHTPFTLFFYFYKKSWTKLYHPTMQHPKRCYRGLYILWVMVKYQVFGATV